MMKYVLLMIIGLVLCFGTSFYMYDGIVNDYSNKQPIFTPLGLILGFFLTFLGLGLTGVEESKKQEKQV